MNVLHYAIQQENEALVWRLLELKPELIHHSSSANGFTPLHMWSSHATSPLHDMQSRLFRMCPQVATDSQTHASIRHPSHKNKFYARFKEERKLMEGEGRYKKRKRKKSSTAKVSSRYEDAEV